MKYGLKGKKIRKLIIKIALLSVLGYVIFLFINQHIKIKNKKDEIVQFNKQSSEKQAEIREILDILNEGDNSEEQESVPKRIFENTIE